VKMVAAKRKKVKKIPPLKRPPQPLERSQRSDAMIQ
jgi:hypothetical protein